MFYKGSLPELLYSVPSVFSGPQNESLSLQSICVSFSVPCSLTSFHLLCFLSLSPSYLPFSPFCPPFNVTCHFPRVPVFCVSATSRKIYYSSLFLLPLPVSPSVYLSIIVCHTGLYNCLSCYSRLYPAFSLTAVLFLSAGA